jgi:type VI secretion system protein ImpG
MPFKHYFQSELTALRQDGKRLAERNPALASSLGDNGRDPDVDRLLESFAFLTGRLRQKIDDDLPELTHSLMNLLWPNYMRPLPAFSMLQFQPLKNSAGLQVPRNTPIQSKEVQGVHCQFRTAYDTEVLPLRLNALNYVVTGDGVTLTLRLGMTSDDSLGQLSLNRLRLHLAGEKYISQTLYLDLLNHLKSIDIVLLDADGKPLNDGHEQNPRPLRLGPERVRPVGFAEEEALIPYPLNTFRGYRYLQEYFAFPDKFMFVDLDGLDCVTLLPEAFLKQARGLELCFRIEKTDVQRIHATTENVRLYCTPVVNLFQHDASPITQDGRQARYLVMPHELDPQHCGIFSVDSVTSHQSGIKHSEHYVPFESFEHDHGAEASKARPHYSVRHQSSLHSNGMDTYLSFSQGPVGESLTMSIELTCTNQNLPLQLKVGDICERCTGTPKDIAFSNITVATASYAPPLHSDYLWKLISNMSLNYLSLANVNALRVILETYDLPRHYDQQAAKTSRKKLQSLMSIGHTYGSRLFRGLPVRGISTELNMNSDNYECEGAMYLFAGVLNEFFALYTSINSFHQLTVKSTKGQEYTWTPRMGLQPLI